MFIRDRDDYRRLGVKTIFGARATRLNTRSKTVWLSNGNKLHYDSLVIATGAAATTPNIDGVRTPGVFTFRNLDDARAIRNRAETARKIILLGAGLVSLETLSALYHPRRAFTVVIGSNQVLSQTLEPEAASLVEMVTKQHGVSILKNRSVTRIREAKDRGLVVTLSSGKRLVADMVVIGKGVSPNIDFVAGTAIECNAGILVNARMETNVPGVYAAGDVAEPRDRVSGERKIHGVWPEAVNQGLVAGTNAAGEKLNYIGAMRMNITHILGQTIAAAGDVRAPRVEDCVVSKDPAEPRYRKIAFDRDGRILGALLINSCGDIGVLQNLIRSGRAVPFLKDRVATSPIGYGAVTLPLANDSLAGPSHP